MSMFQSKPRFAIMIRLMAAAAIALTLIYVIDATHRPLSNLTQSRHLSSNLEKKDWKVYPIGCHILQLPDNYRLISWFSDHDLSYFAVPREIVKTGATINSLHLDVDHLPTGTFSIQFHGDTDLPNLYEKTDIGWPHLIAFDHGMFEDNIDYYNLNKSNERHVEGMEVADYYKSGRNPNFVDATSRRPSIPTNGKFAILFYNDLDPGDQDYHLIKEISKTLRVDQRLFNQYSNTTSRKSPFDEMIPGYGLFEVGSLSVEDFNALPGDMDQSEIWSHEDRKCKDSKMSLLRPPRYLPDYRGVITVHLNE